MIEGVKILKKGGRGPSFKDTSNCQIEMKQSSIIIQIEGAIWFGLNDLFLSPFPDNSWCPCSQRILDQGLTILHTYCFIRYRMFLRMIVFIAEGIYSNCLITDCKKMSQALLSTTVPSTCMQLLNICSITSFYYVIYQAQLVSQHGYSQLLKCP